MYKDKSNTSQGEGLRWCCWGGSCCHWSQNLSPGHQARRNHRSSREVQGNITHSPLGREEVERGVSTSGHGPSIDFSGFSLSEGKSSSSAAVSTVTQAPQAPRKSSPGHQAPSGTGALQTGSILDSPSVKTIQT